METQTPQKTGTDTAVQVIGAIFGTAHLIFQSLADATAHAEGSLVESVTKGAIKKDEVIANRRNVTNLRQKQFMDKINAAKAKLKEKAEAKSEHKLDTAA